MQVTDNGQTFGRPPQNPFRLWLQHMTTEQNLGWTDGRGVGLGHHFDFVAKGCATLG
ncbi:MAG: hypothetical protein Alpg2KO_16260 [Alphaproteobacteria bacterium]